LGSDLNLAGGHLWIDIFFAAQADLSDRGNDIFGTGLIGFGVPVRCEIPIQNHLSNSSAVAHVEKYEVSMIAAPVYPAHQYNLLAGVLRPELAAGMSTLKIA
jgi:hypothetical protein